jgi:hypothetical protein
MASARAGGNGNGGAAPAKALEDRAPTTEAEDAGEGYTLESIMDFTMEQLASMDNVLAGKVKLGRNMNLMGFFQKAPDAQLVGVVRRMKEQTNRIDTKNTDLILYIEGKAKYPKDVIDPDDGKVKVKAGEYQALFAFQLDSATGAFWGEDMIGARVHFHVKGMEKLPSGLKRYAYHRAGFLPARVDNVDW